MKLNNTIATPLYKQLEEKIRKEIDAGERAVAVVCLQKMN